LTKRYQSIINHRESILTSPRIIRRLLLATTLAWGLSSTVVRADIGDEPLPNLINELQHMSPGERDETLRIFNEQMTQVPAPVREQKRQWFKQQWAALSPEQRDQLRNQIREHRQRLPPDQRQQFREDRRSDERPDRGFENIRQSDDGRPQRLSPDERNEFRQWMRERRGG
jgi:hypothetical protein